MTEVCEFPEHNAPDDAIEAMLKNYRTVAVVGISTKPHRDSYQVAAFLQEHGYRVIPVNPRYDEVLGEKCYPSLLKVPGPVEIVDIFRRPDAVPEIVEQAIQVGAKVVWMQLGIVHNEAAKKALSAGLDVVMSRCIKIEYQRMQK